MKNNNVTTRGRRFTGTVISDKAQQTVTVEWQSRKSVPKYERFMIRRTRVKAHNPPEMKAAKGDKVIIAECRPLSKTKKFVVVEKLGRDITFLEKEERELEEMAKHDKPQDKEEK